MAEKLRRAVEAFRFAWGGREFAVGVSIGMVNFRDDSMTQAGMLSMADAACYLAKDRGRNCIHVYRADDQELARRHGDMERLLELQQALNEDRFVLYMQRIQPLKRESVGEHFEVLVRMLDVDGALVPPGLFLPAAERYQLMPAIDRWVVRNTFIACQRALTKNPAAIECCAINLSGASLGDPSLLGFVREQFELYQVPYHLICFEVTETAAISNITLAMGFIREMKALGCRFALDDFGSGMSSFGYLKHLPVDYLKIDGSFVKDMLNNPSDLAVVESIHQIGQIFGIETVAEFVENEAIRARLVEAGVDFAQGYGIAKPMPLALDNEPLVTGAA